MDRNTQTSRAGTCPTQPLMEELEQRIVLSGFSWTSEEVYLAELVNRARANPSAEALRLGIDLTDGLTASELARYGPSEPLALNAFLTMAARAHALDMAERGFFEHVNPDGDDPTDRATGAGYGGVVGENIAAGYTSVDDAHYGWMESLGHRLNVLSLHDYFDDDFHYDELGVGAVYTDELPYYNYFSQSFGIDGGQTYILGVVFGDNDSDDFYSIGEGFGQIFIDVAPVDDLDTIVGTYTTGEAGNYQISVDPGEYRVRFTDLTSGATYTQNVTVTDENMKVDAQGDQFTVAPDDHVDSDDLPNATVISIDGGTGTGTGGGVINYRADGDLFRFDAVSTGEITIQIANTGGSLDPSGLLFDERGLPLQFSVSPVGVFTGTITFSVVTGQTYYLAVSSLGGETVGDYSVTIDGRAAGTGAHPGDGVSSALEDALSAVADAGDHYAAVVIGAGGLPMVYENMGSGWDAVSLLDEAGGSTAIGEAVSFVDQQTGLFNVASPTAEGLMLYTRAGDGTWTVRNLTAEDPASVNVVGQLQVLEDTDGLAHIAGLSAEGHLVVYSQLEGGGSLSLYGMADITAAHLEAQSLGMPSFTGELVSFVTAWNGLNVVGLDSSGDMWAVWWAPGMDLWSVHNLSDLTDAPAYTGGLTPFLTSWGAINIAGTTADGDLNVTWWVPGMDTWWVSNLTDLVGGPQIQSDSLASFVTPWGGLNIVGLNGSGTVTTYWWAPTLTSWIASPLSAPGVSAPTGSLASIASPGGVLNIFGNNDDGDLTRYFWDPAGIDLWFGENITDLAVL
jgi:hypothetical protein